MTLYDLRVISRQGNSIIKTFVYDSKTSMADNVHKALDIAGFIPGIGSFSEGANSLLYAFQGEKGEAALAALSVIPGIKAVKVLKDGIQYLKIIPESGEASKALKELYDAEKTAGNTGHVIERSGKAIEPTKVITDHSSIPSRGAPNSVVDYIGQDGNVNARIFYDEEGKMVKQINPNDHNNSKLHPYGENGEHAHDIIWKDGKIVDRTSRELTQEEVEQNSKIIK
ncbi:hypothetical protein [Pectinatus frisingensis]|uniref:hypothetical protein n=1 Tax=Pectinatus frisingensis TaxID=865 RepID=UPI003D8003FB